MDANVPTISHRTSWITHGQIYAQELLQIRPHKTAYKFQFYHSDSMEHNHISEADTQSAF